MRVVKFMYGLGNQLFQYAFYMKLNKLYGDDIYADIEWYDAPGRHPWDVFQINMLGLNPRVISRDKYCVKEYYMKNHQMNEVEFKEFANNCNIPIINLVSQKHGYLGDKIWLVDDAYYFGFFQNIDLIKEGICDVKENIVFPQWNDHEFMEIRKKILKDDKSVSIHVRMDYNVHEPECYEKICTDKYFADAVNMISLSEENAHFYVFSNKIDEARKRLAWLDRAEYIDLKERHFGIEDMELMSLCRHNILSNSTFSWWAAVLNDNPNKMVVIPDVYDTRIKGVGRDDVNLYFPDWIRVAG